MTTGQETKEQKWTAEPWYTMKGENVVGVQSDCGGPVIYWVDKPYPDHVDYANARRIVACVNYCAGTSTNELVRRTESRRCPEGYGVKSLRMMRTLREAGRLSLDADGRVILPSGKTHNGTPIDGRDRVNLFLNGERCTCQTARVVCFLEHGEPPEPNSVVDHIDGDTLNNKPENLRWASYSENTTNTEDNRKRDPLAGIEDPKAKVEGLVEAVKYADELAKAHGRNREPFLKALKPWRERGGGG